MDTHGHKGTRWRQLEMDGYTWSQGYRVGTVRGGWIQMVTAVPGGDSSRWMDTDGHRGTGWGQLEVDGYRWSQGVVMNFVLYHYCNLILVIWSAYIGRAVWYFRDLHVCVPCVGSVATGRLGLFTLTAAIFERPSPPLREQSSMIKLWLNHIIAGLTPCLKV